MMQKILTRDFLLGFVAQFTFSVGSHIFYPTLPIYLSRLGTTAADIGVLIGILGASSLVFRPIIGRALLGIPEKKLMILGALLHTLTSGAYLVVLPFWPLFVVRIFQGIALACFYTASFTFISNISPEARRGQSVSYYLMAVNISLALGPSLGMLIINRVSFSLLFLTCIGLSLCSLFFTSKLENRHVTPLQDSSGKDGFLLSTKALPFSMMSFFFHFTWGSLIAFFPLYATEHGVGNPGFFFTTVALMIISGRALGGKILDRYNLDRIILPCLFINILSMIILSFSKTLPMFILVSVIWGIGHAFLFPSLLVYVLHGTGPSRGLAMGTFTGFSDLGMSLGPMTMGILIHATNYPTMFLCLALTGIISLTYFYFFVRKQ
jgi:MFS family permease